MSLEPVEWAASWSMVLPYFDGRMPAGFPSPAKDYLETPLNLTEYLIENKAATFMMRVDGDSMKDAGILDGDLLVVSGSEAGERKRGCGRSQRRVHGQAAAPVDRTACGSIQQTLGISLSVSL